VKTDFAIALEQTGCQRQNARLFLLLQHKIFINLTEDFFVRKISQVCNILKKCHANIRAGIITKTHQYLPLLIKGHAVVTHVYCYTSKLLLFFLPAKETGCIFNITK